MPRTRRTSKAANPGAKTPTAETYRHPDSELLLRPEVGTQAQFRKKKPPVTYRYDSSLSPALEWDGQNAARELGEWLLALVSEAAALEAPHRLPHPREFRGADGKVLATVTGLQDAVDQLRRLGKPFLNWAGKAERLSFDVPTLPLFVHERLSTKAIVETLTGHLKNKQLGLDLFGDPQHTITDQVLGAYEHKDKWVNRLVLGDSLVVMNSLLHYEGLGGQVQMIYMDPPYGIKFGSNFQPFVRKREVTHNDDVDMTREPEMVKAYRDTWELGLHSYLTYLRDRLLLVRELLTPTGSVFVQISDDNLHHVREVMDEVFGTGNYVGQIAFRKTGGQSVNLLPSTYDFVLHYARDVDRIKFRPLWVNKIAGGEGAKQYTWLESPDGKEVRQLTDAELAQPSLIPEGWRVFRPGPLSSPGVSGPSSEPITVGGVSYSPGGNRHWSIGTADTVRLAEMGRTFVIGNTLCSKLYLDDLPVSPLKNVWSDTGGSGFAEKPLCVVQTDPLVVMRCMLMTTDPGDLVLDPTCGGGTTACVAEQWGRRWVTADVSRVPLALARQALLCRTYDYYELADAAHGPAAGFVYRRRRNQRGREIGGIVPHVTLKALANGDPPGEEVLVDRPEAHSAITRVTGPFCVEATIPAPVDWEGDGEEDSGLPMEQHGSFLERMIEVLRKSPVLHVGGGKSVTLRSVRPPAKTLSLSAEAAVANGDDRPAAILFGPENGAISEKLVYEAAREAHAKGYHHLYVMGFAIQPNARQLIDSCEAAVGIPATYVQATPDLMMGDLLKNMRSSQIFSVCGLPDVRLRKAKGQQKGEPPQCEVELLGLDVFDPATNETHPMKGDDVPAWFLDTDYNGLCFHVCQAFFPRTSAWDNLRRSLRMTYDESVWDHLAGTVSAPFEPGEHQQVAVKVIDDRGNELLVVKKLSEAV
jgi:adenine-specific DNA-methyltransferase